MLRLEELNGEMWVEHAFQALIAKHRASILFTGCHPERSEEAKPTNAVERICCSCAAEGISEGGEQQVPPLRFATVGMTIN